MAANLFFVCRSYRKLLLVPMLQERPGRWRMVQQFQKPLSQEKRLLQQLGGCVLLQEWMIFHYWFKTVGTLVDSRIPEKQTQTVLQNGCSHCNSSVRLYIRDPLNFCSPPELPRSNGLLNFILHPVLGGKYPYINAAKRIEDAETRIKLSTWQKSSRLDIGVLSFDVRTKFSLQFDKPSVVAKGKDVVNFSVLSHLSHPCLFGNFCELRFIAPCLNGSARYLWCHCCNCGSTPGGGFGILEMGAMGHCRGLATICSFPRRLRTPK